MEPELLIDKFAAAALSGLLGSADVDSTEYYMERVCLNAYQWAYVMLLKREHFLRVCTTLAEKYQGEDCNHETLSKGKAAADDE